MELFFAVAFRVLSKVGGFVFVSFPNINSESHKDHRI